MISFYIIRKLLEAGKTSKQAATLSVPLIKYNRGPVQSGAVVAPILWAHYDLDTPVRSPRDLKFVCHQIVHSYVFSVAVAYQGGWVGVYFASDFQRNKSLFFITAASLVRVLRVVGNDPKAEFSGWVEERLRTHLVQTAFPPRRFPGERG